MEVDGRDSHARTAGDDKQPATGGDDDDSCSKSCGAVVSIKYRKSEGALKEYGHWEAPNEMDAREKYIADHTHHDVFDIGCPVKDLKEFGEGILLYFYLLKYTAIVFSVLAVMPGLLLIIFNGLGGWYDKADVERTMLGNYGLISHTGRSTDVLNATTSDVAGTRAVSVEGLVSVLFTSTSAAEAAAKMAGMDKAGLLVAMSVLDLAGIAIYFFACCYMIWFVRSESNAADRNTVTIKDFSVRVQRLPPDTQAAALRDYLLAAAGEGAEIVQVELCRKVDTLLALVLERGEVVDQHDLAEAVLQRSAEVYPKISLDLEVDVLDAKFRLTELNEAIREEQAAADKNQVVSAFVVFATAEARYHAMEGLPRGHMRQLRMAPDKKFNNRGIGKAGTEPVALHISAAPEPSDVQFENLEFGLWARIWRKTATNAAKYVVLLIGFALVSLAPAMRKGLSSTSSGTSPAECAKSCVYRDAAGNIAISAANRTVYRACDPVAGSGTLPNKLDCEAQAVCYECYCRAALNAGEYAETPYCSRFSSVVAVSVLAQALAVLGIVVANILIQYAIDWLTHKEKHHTRSHEAVSMARGLFITQFINTAFSNLVANMYLPGPARVVSGSLLEGYIFSGTYADTTPDWFHDVGRPIVISIFVNTIITHMKVGLWWWLRRYKLARRYRSLTQKQLNDGFKGHEFELAIKYGQHLYVVFVVLTYSSGMPFLYILAAVHFISCYWSEKYELLKVCKRPLAYSRDLAQYVSTTLPFAALWHLAFAIWFYGLFGLRKSPLITGIFYDGLVGVIRKFGGLISRASAMSPQTVAWRFTQADSAHLFIAFIAISGGLFLFFTLSGWLQCMRGLGSLLGVIKDSGTAGEHEYSNVPEFGVAVRSQLLLGPATYSVHENPAYAHAFVRMEEFNWDRKELEAKAATMPENPGGLVAAINRRVKKTAAGRLRSKRDAPVPAGGGVVPGLGALLGGVFIPGLAAVPAMGGAPGVAPGGNKVAPLPQPAQPPRTVQAAQPEAAAPLAGGLRQGPGGGAAQPARPAAARPAEQELVLM